VTVTLHYMSGSPYAWRVWLALEYKQVPYRIETMSYDAGDFSKPEFLAIAPRRRVPVIVDNGFALYESAAIVEYIEDRWPQAPHLFSSDLRRRAIERRLVREADQYVAAGLEHLVEAVLFTPRDRRSPDKIAAALGELGHELANWETLIAGTFLAGDLSAADFTLYPELELVRRIGNREPGMIASGLIGPNIASWMDRMRALPLVEKTWPPHWRP
jgi:glutathione S-transferase